MGEGEGVWGRVRGVGEGEGVLGEGEGGVEEAEHRPAC